MRQPMRVSTRWTQRPIRNATAKRIRNWRGANPGIQKSAGTMAGPPGWDVLPALYARKQTLVNVRPTGLFLDRRTLDGLSWGSTFLRRYGRRVWPGRGFQGLEVERCC